MILTRNTSFDDVLNEVARFTIGFEPMFRQFDTFRSIPLQGYPPYNLEKVDDTHQILTLAVAGFGQDDIQVTVEGRVLTVVGDNGPTSVEGNDGEDVGPGEPKQYLYKGIASRQFRKEFVLSERAEVTKCLLKDGLLTVEFVINEPETKVKKIMVSVPTLYDHAKLSHFPSSNKDKQA